MTAIHRCRLPPAPTSIAWRRRRRPICSSTSTIRSTGGSGGRRRLAEAKRSNRPIMLSIGYAACHWCHVMAHESFEDEATARGDERAVRQHQGRPRGAARHRPDLHERAASPRRAGRLAADHVSDAVGRAGVGRHVFPEGIEIRPAGLHRHPARSVAAVPRRAARRSSRTAPRCWRGSPTGAAGRARWCSA